MTRLARSALAAAFFAAFGIGGVALGCVLFPLFALAGRRRGRILARASVRATYKLFVSAGEATRLFRVDVPPADRARIAAARGCVVVARHQTLIDVVVLLSLLGDSTCVVKGAAARNPFYGRIVRFAFAVNDDPERALAETSRLLADGVNVLFFPEGTRTRAHENAKLRRGAARLALSARAPIFALGFSCSPPVLAKGQPWHDVADRTIVYSVRAGRVIGPTGDCSRANAVALTGRVAAELAAAAPPQNCR